MTGEKLLIYFAASFTTSLLYPSSVSSDQVLFLRPSCVKVLLLNLVLECVFFFFHGKSLNIVYLLFAIGTKFD